MTDDLNPSATNAKVSGAKPAGTREVLAMAACFGLATGLVEGAGLLFFQKLRWMSWLMYQMRVAPEILWISPVVALLLFIVVGLALGVAMKLFRRAPGVVVAVFVFSTLLVFDWLSVSGQLRMSGVVPFSVGVGMVLARWARSREERVLHLTYRALPWLAAAAVLVLAVVAGGGWLRERWAIGHLPKPAAGTPNMIVIVLDTVRADHVSAYGYERTTTPHVDRFAQQGVLFENAIATSSWTLPSHASMLTGRYPFEHGAERDQYDGRYTMLPEVLTRYGLRNAAISANHFFFVRQNGFGRGFQHFEDYFHSATDMALRTLYGRKFEQYVLNRGAQADAHYAVKRAPQVTDAALRWIARDPDVPFFLFLNYFDAHPPYSPPEPYRSRFASPRERGAGKQGGVKKSIAEQAAEKIDAYDASIAFADEHVGRLLDELEKRGLAENTIVIITSDHGESFGEHGFFGRRYALYRELIRVPLLIRWPGRIPAGGRVSAPVTTAALPATLLDLIGAGKQTDFPIPSFAWAWQGQEQTSEHPIPLAELAQFQFDSLKDRPCYYGAAKSLVTPEWQFIRHDTLGVQLYDWQNDPGQKNNLTETATGHQAVAMFSDKLKEIISGGRNVSAGRSGANAH